MTDAACLEVDETTEGRDRRKRLGQFFTDIRLARLLAALADAPSAKTILDPMAGQGDMLLACWQRGARPVATAAIEIDGAAAAFCRERLSSAGVVAPAVTHGDAFDPSTLGKLTHPAWELVITNPPYVRYQTGARIVERDLPIPSAADVRRQLLQFVEDRAALSDADRGLFTELVRGYSGLSDLAVPAWILCAALVAAGGRLAIVAPETWLSRNYAETVQYMLARCFDIEYVVEDADAAWFPDAQVKTTLLVARRVRTRTSVLSASPREGYASIQLRRYALSPLSAVGTVFPGASDPDGQLVDLARVRQRASDDWRVEHCRVNWVSGPPWSGSLKRAVSVSALLRRLEPHWNAVIHASEPRHPLLPMASPLRALSVRWCSLSDLGWGVGQGLRTGANLFFYVDELPDSGRTRLVRAADAFGGRIVEVPEDALLAVVRRQSEIPCQYAVHPTTLTGRVLWLDGYVLPSDAAIASAQGFSQLFTRYHVMPDSLAEHVRRAGRFSLPGDSGRRIPLLSAVSTNVRAYRPAKPAASPRFWYQLPPLAQRHRGELMVPRVNGDRARVIHNPERAAVVDANFSTLWPVNDGAVNAHALLAMLNGTLCSATLEIMGTAMGGGALKVEATHLRRLQLPLLSSTALGALEQLGRDLARIRGHAHDSRALVSKIDAVIADDLACDATEGKEVNRATRVILAESLEARSRRGRRLSPPNLAAS